MQYVKSAIHYAGNKFKLISKYNMLDYFPKNIDTFYDIFAGSAVVSMNVNAKKYIVNDLSRTYDIYNVFKYAKSSKHLLDTLDNIIDTLGLAKSYDKLKLKKSKNAYLKLRDLYNTTKNGIYLFLLSQYCFSNTIRFNTKNEFNQAYGQRMPKYDINDLDNTIAFFKQKNVKCYNESAYDLQVNRLKKNDFVYLDPPYLITNAGYNIGYESDIELFTLCKSLIDHNIRFAMSNVLVHKDRKNTELRKFCKTNKLKIIHFDGIKYGIRGASYNTNEVLILNDIF